MSKAWRRRADRCTLPHFDGVTITRNRGHEPRRRRLWRRFRTGLEAYENWFWLQADAPNFLHTLLDLFFQCEDVGRGRAAPIDDRQGMLGGNADALGAALRWERSRNDELFPHLYGELDLGAVVRIHDMPARSDGSHHIPELAP